jgi:hypothetical protein
MFDYKNTQPKPAFTALQAALLVWLAIGLLSSIGYVLGGFYDY